jgi:NYN domain
MLAHVIDNAAPSTIVLISGDRDFAYALSILRFRRYRVVLITLSNAHQSLRAQASISFDWVSEVLEPVDPTLLNQPTSPRRGKISSPPAHDKFYSDFMGHDPSSSLFQETRSEKSAKSVEPTMNKTCSKISRTPSKHDSLPLYSERQFAASSKALNNGPEAPAEVLHSPVASCHTYPKGSIQTPLATTACSSESNFSSRTTLTPTHPLKSLQNSRLMETSCRALDLLSDKLSLNHESSRLSHQQGSTSPINASQRLSSVGRMAVDNNHPGSPLVQQSLLANVTAKATAPAPFLIPSSPTLSSGTVSATTQISTNPLQPTPSPAVPDKFKILAQCLKSHRSRGSVRPLRSIIGLEINQNGTTYRMAGVLKFSEYMEMARKAGIVDLGGFGGAAWVALRAPWYNAPIS